ncbi:MAG: imidazolonepropionase, partial [Rhizobiaceae bacterium]
MLLTNATLATMAGRDAYGLVVDGVIATDGGKIVWLGKASELPVELAGGETIDLGGRLVTPGLIDCHTH